VEEALQLLEEMKDEGVGMLRKNMSCFLGVGFN